VVIHHLRRIFASPLTITTAERATNCHRSDSARGSGIVVRKPCVTRCPASPAAFEHFRTSPVTGVDNPSPWEYHICKHMNAIIHDTRLPAEERAKRSRLRQLLHQGGFLRGSLFEMKRYCRRPSCHCAQGEPHRLLYLAQSHQGRQRNLYIPAAYEPRVREWVARYKEARQLLDGIAETYRERVRERKD